MNSQLGKQLLKHIENGNVEEVDNFLKQNFNLNIDERDQDGQSFLMIACRLKHEQIVRRLLEELSVEDVNAVDNDDWSSLLNAAKSGSVETVKMLLDAGATLEHRDMAGWTALMWASYKGWAEVAEVLLQRNANPNVKGEHHMSCLTWAAGRGHADVVCSLLRYGSKVNTADKYGTTPLIWAARKGHHDIVFQLLKAGAVIDKAGMNSWTALIVASRGGYANVVRLLLDHHPNVNAVDKDGFTALGMAAKEGYVEIVNMLLHKNAYGNLTDREGDTILIHAVKSNHIEVVKMLLKKYADVDIQGVDNKTALYWAVEKGHLLLAKLLLENNANMELTNKDGDTSLLRAVRNRNFEMVQLLVEKGAKVSAIDKRGDNCLHVSVRSRSRRITEVLLRNPKNSKLLYLKNKKGETAYGIDASHDRSLLAQVFGAKNLNADDNLHGYELYSATIADVLSEPSLRTPITVGLFARWGSGKSYMIKRLREEMEAYTDLGDVQKFSLGFIHVFFALLLSLVVGFIFGVTLQWPVGLGIGVLLFMLQIAFYVLVWFGSNRRGWSASITIGNYLAKQAQFTTLLLKLIFSNVPEQRNRDTLPIRFIFTDNVRLNTIMGEKTIISIIGTLCDALEDRYGIVTTRLYRIFKPKKAAEHGKYKCLCCIPHFVIVLVVVVCIFVSAFLLFLFGFDSSFSTPHSVLVNSIILVLLIIVGASIVINFYTWYKVLVNLIVPTRKQIQKISSKAIPEVSKLDSVVHILKKEVDLIGWMVRTMDSFTGNHTRMVVVVDGLDTCEQDKLLNILDLVHILFGDTNSPFVTILAVDPHIIIKGIEHNINSQFRDTSINGHDYLRNIVQLPFFIQSQCLPKPYQKVMTRYDNIAQQSMDSHAMAFNCHRQESQISGASYLSLTDIGKGKQGRRRMMSINNPLSNSTTMLRQPSFYDLSKSLGKTSYFSDVNPRSMKRLMNILAVTGRLLRALNIEFNWYKLASWINLTEQWPYRLSWIILEVEDNESIDDQQSIKFVYDRVNPKIPSSRDVDPLVEIDRNVRKLEVFLSSNSPLLSVADMKRFLPCTINIDPYLRKLIRELQQSSDNSIQGEMYGMSHPYDYFGRGTWSKGQFSVPRKRNHSGSPGIIPPTLASGASYQQLFPGALYMTPPIYQNKFEHPIQTQPTHPITLKGEVPRKGLPQLSTNEICSLIEKIDGISLDMVRDYVGQLQANNISGLVLSNCDMKELKSILKMKFGDWELFRCMVETLKNDSSSSAAEEPQRYRPRMVPKDTIFGCKESTPPPRSKPAYLPTIQGSLEYSKEDVNLELKTKIVDVKNKETEIEQMNAKGESIHQLSRHDSFEKEVLMENEALINIVEATGVDSESEGSSDGLHGSCTDMQRSGISPIPEEEVLAVNHISAPNFPKHALLSRQASQDEPDTGGIFFVGPDNDSGESDSEEVERLSHKNIASKKQSSMSSQHFVSVEKTESTMKRGRSKGTTAATVSTDSTVPLLDLHTISFHQGSHSSSTGVTFVQSMQSTDGRVQHFDAKMEESSAEFGTGNSTSKDPII